MKNFLFIILLVFCSCQCWATGAPNYVPDGAYPRLHSAADIARLSDHYTDNDDIWTDLVAFSSGVSYPWQHMYRDAMVGYIQELNGADGSTNLSDAETMLKTYDETAFTNLNAWRNGGVWGPLTYDLLVAASQITGGNYEGDFTGAEQIACGDNMNDACRVTAVHASPDDIIDNHSDDTDQCVSSALTWALTGAVTYNNGSTNYNTTTCAAMANWYRNGTQTEWFDTVIETGLVSGFWWTGTGYTRHESWYIWLGLYGVKNATGYDYTTKETSYADLGNTWAKQISYSIPPDKLVANTLSYGDTESGSSTLGSEYCIALGLIANQFTSTTYAPIARWWANYLRGGSTDNYMTPLCALAFDDDASTTDPETVQNRAYKSPDMIGNSSYEYAVNYYSASSWDDSATAIAMQIKGQYYNHSQDDQGHFWLYRNGEKLLWEYPTYSENNSGYLFHNNFVMYCATCSAEQTRSYKRFPRHWYNDNPLKVGIDRFVSDQAYYSYARGDMWGGYNPEYGTYTEESFVSTAQREIIHIFPDYIVMYDRSIWETGHTSLWARIHTTIWKTSSAPSNSSGTVSGTTTGGQYIYGHYLLPASSSISVVDDTATFPVGTCGTSGYPTCANRSYTVHTSPSSEADSVPFLSVFYGKDASGAKTIEYFGQDAGTSITNTHDGAIIYDSTRDMIAVFSKDATDDTAVSLTFTPTGSSGYRVVIADLTAETYSVSISGSSEKTVAVSSTGSAYTVDSNGVLAFDVSAAGVVSQLSGSEEAPTSVNVTIDSAGTTLTLTMSEFVTNNYPTTLPTLSMSGGAVTASCLSCLSGTSLTYTLSRAVHLGETGTYSWDVATNGVEDVQGDDLADISGAAITNNSTHPYDTTPDAFTFTDITGAALSTVYTSNTITVAGIEAAAAISITGGTYSINGGAYTAVAGTITVGQTATVRVTSSASTSTIVNGVLTIGGVSDTYSVATLDVPSTPTGVNVNIQSCNMTRY